MGTCPRAHSGQRRAVPTGPCSGHPTSSYQALGSHLPQSPTSHHAAQHPFNHNRARTSKQKLSMAKNVQPQTAFSPLHLANNFAAKQSTPHPDPEIFSARA